MLDEFAAIFSRPGAPSVRPAVLGKALVHIEDGILSLRAVATPHIARHTKLSPQTVHALLDVSVPTDAPGGLGAVQLEFGATDVRRPGFALHPNVPALFWRFSMHVVRVASEGRGELLTASGADAFAFAARTVEHVDCNLALSHRREDGPWIRDVDVVRVGPGLELYAARRRRLVRAETELLGVMTAMTFEPLGFTVKTASGSVRVLAGVKHEAELRRLGGESVLARVSARVNRDGQVADAILLKIDAVRSTRDPVAYYLATRGKGDGLFSTPEAKEYLQSLRRHEDDD